MNHSGSQVALFVLVSVLGACGAPRSTPSAPTAAGLDAGAAEEAAAPRPFASTPVQAQTLIQDQIEGHMKPLWKCVNDYRMATNDSHKAVTIEIGIDEEGNLLGLTSVGAKQGALDPTLKACMWNALHGAPFPRSHAGIITVRQAFTDASITP